MHLPSKLYQYYTIKQILKYKFYCKNLDEIKTAAKRTTVPDAVVFLRKVRYSLRIILIFFSSYGLYRTLKSNLVLLFTMLLW